jgi:isocitrate dehydrogenase (NAD+)
MLRASYFRDLIYRSIIAMIDVTLITGDGTGPELAQAARRCIDATKPGINWEIAEAGVDVMEREGTPLPEATVKSIRKNGIALK